MNRAMAGSIAHFPMNAARVRVVVYAGAASIIAAFGTEEMRVDLQHEVVAMLDRVLELHGRGRTYVRDTPLLGDVPELDSMAVATLIGTIEEQFGFVIDDGEIDGSTFATVGSLVDFVQSKLAA